MRLLLLLPILALMSVSGFNLSAGNNSFAVVVLHLLVMAMCIIFIAMIVKSMFTVKYVEMPEKETRKAYEGMDLQHS
ncbi:hypothetical protein OGH69_00650 [Flavobacterium sp. MFBS3-15]|uniref:hypothetical protein n=1 Tax=Flavobacterium sp. MFBS3-15 TaxID=2989816 RepID=UPI00223548AB|nr:hypothetical protein [Flavobacterium sp. MFBS3-15]MCW4467463.1 hypothetical protein [Flavobacterium sp. MFBS3-15]